MNQLLGIYLLGVIAAFVLLMAYEAAFNYRMNKKYRQGCYKTSGGRVLYLFVGSLLSWFVIFPALVLFDWNWEGK